MRLNSRGTRSLRFFVAGPARLGAVEDIAALKHERPALRRYGWWHADSRVLSYWGVCSGLGGSKLDANKIWLTRARSAMSHDTL